MAVKTNFWLLIKIPQQLADDVFPSLPSPQPGFQLLIMTGSKGKVTLYDGLWPSHFGYGFVTSGP